MGKMIAVCAVAALALGASPTPPTVLKEKLDKGEKVLVIDVRSDEEVKTGSIPGAIHIPMEQLEARMKDVPKNVQLVFT